MNLKSKQVFHIYVKDLFGLQVHNETRLTTIRDRLLEVFDQVGEAAE